MAIILNGSYSNKIAIGNLNISISFSTYRVTRIYTYLFEAKHPWLFFHGFLQTLQNVFIKSDYSLYVTWQDLGEKPEKCWPVYS